MCPVRRKPRAGARARLERPDRGVALEQFVFRLRSRERLVTLFLREGQVTEEFIAMAGTRIAPRPTRTGS